MEALMRVNWPPFNETKNR